jgi:hypothetical protein
MRAKDLAWWSSRRDFAAAWPALVQRHRWVFLVGCNNSGTTLIHDSLAETGRFSCMPHEGQRYTNVIRRAEKRGHERVWSEYMGELRLDESSRGPDAPRLWFDWLREIPPPVKPYILEKTTANAVRMRWLQQAFPEASFVGVVRNGYAVVEGIARKGGKDVRRGARHWRVVNEHMLADSAFLSRFFLLKYEDFVAAPALTLEKLGVFLGFRAGELVSSQHAASDRTGDSASAAIRDMNTASFRRLTRRDLDAINQEAGSTFAHFGYTCL